MGKNINATHLKKETPYYMLGYECDWLFHIDDNNMEIPKAKVLLKDIAENNFNMVVCNLWTNKTEWEYAKGNNSGYDFSNPDEIPFLRNENNTIDYSKINYKYFDRIDKIFEQSKYLGINIHLMIYVWNKCVPWKELFSPEDNKMFKYVIDRFCAYPNIIWDISKEALNYATGKQILDKCTLLKSLDPFSTLLTKQSQLMHFHLAICAWMMENTIII